MTDLLERLKRALPHVLEWIDDLHAKYSGQAVPADSLGFPRLSRYVPERILQSARTVTVDHIPFPPISAYGLPELESVERMEMAGITFRNLYFVHQANPAESIHLHELVHVVQWNTLGPDDFLLTWALGVVQHGYAECPLEAIAHDLQNRFEKGAELPPLVDYVTPHARAARDSTADVFRSHGLTMGG